MKWPNEARQKIGRLIGQRPVRKLSLLLRGYAPITRPVFVVGTARSNTTFLAACLSEHSALTNPGGELVELWTRDGVLPMGVPSSGESQCPRRTEEDVSDGAAGHIRRRFARRLAMREAHRGTRLVTHNPHLSNKLRAVSRVFPDATFIVTYRDIYSTVASLKRLWEWAFDRYGMVIHLPKDTSACWSCSATASPDTSVDRVFPGGSARTLAEYWLSTYQQIERDAAELERVVYTSHGEFLEDGSATMSSLFEGLGLTPEPCPALDRLDTRRNKRWRETLSPSEQNELESFVEAHKSQLEGLRHVSYSPETA